MLFTKQSQQIKHFFEFFLFEQQEICVWIFEKIGFPFNLNLPWEHVKILTFRDYMDIITSFEAKYILTGLNN